MYAFALLDTWDATLTLARDPFGIKPLYYVANDGQFAFASEIKALLDLDWIDRRVNPEALLAYLAVGRSDHGEETMFAQVRQVPAAGLLTLDVADTPRVLRELRTWAPSPGAMLDVSRDEAAQMVRDTFFGSVERHLRSDVPIGTALSGGLDSSAIITSMRRVAPDIQLHAFSYFAEEPSINEERWVRAAAAASGATVHEVTVSPTALPRDIDTLIRNQDEPFGSTSIYAQYNVFRAAAAAGIHVMLDGQGADELLGGYGSFVAPHVASLLFRSRLASAGRLLLSARGRADVDLRAIARYVVAASVPRAVKTRLSKRYAASALPSWISAKWFADRLPSLKVEQADPGPDLRAILARETQTSLLALLRYEDRNSMTSSVESLSAVSRPPVSVELGLNRRGGDLIARTARVRPCFVMRCAESFPMSSSTGETRSGFKHLNERSSPVLANGCGTFFLVRPPRQRRVSHSGHPRPGARRTEWSRTIYSTLAHFELDSVVGGVRRAVRLIAHRVDGLLTAPSTSRSLVRGKRLRPPLQDGRRSESRKHRGVRSFPAMVVRDGGSAGQQG